MRKRIPVAWPITAVAFGLAMSAVVTTRPAVAAGNPYQRGPDFIGTGAVSTPALTCTSS